jgi:predicted SprT family Zn-dependent metalloprotease
MGYRPMLVWKNLRVSAGIAYTRAKSIALSRVLLTTESTVAETLRHEYAHLLAVHRAGPKGGGHGVHWRQAMVDLGAEPKVYHKFSVERNKRHQRVTYECLTCGRLIERSRKLPHRRRYLHAGCGGDIRLKQVERVSPSSPGSSVQAA